MKKFIYTDDKDTAELLGQFFYLLQKNNGTYVFINDETSTFYQQAHFNNKNIRTSDILTF